MFGDHEFDLWTLDPVTGEMDQCIKRDINDRATAEKYATDEADGRERNILILQDGAGYVVITPDGDRIHV